MSSFRKDLIVKSFSTTGIWPMDLEVILERFTETYYGAQVAATPVMSQSSSLSRYTIYRFKTIFSTSRTRD